MNQKTISGAGEIVAERVGQVGSVTLNRPKALNALTPGMVAALDAALIAWAKDPAVRAVVVRGAPREDGKTPFCAGGDIRLLYEQRGDPDRKVAAGFYAEEYRLNRRIHNYPKPYVALIDGVVMGGGVGVSLHGSHRVMSENTLFAMPETGIGFFPDVGASWFLPRCPGHYGLYLGLTGARIGVADAIHLGLATHHVKAAKIAALDRALREADYKHDAHHTVDAVIEDFAEPPPDPPIEAHHRLIERAFSAPSVEQIVARLEADGGPFASATLAQLRAKSPLSLKLTFRLLNEANGLSFEERMKREYRIAMHCNHGHDFFEGVRAVLVDKDQSPKWRPASLGEATDAMVAGYFEPPPGGDMTFD
ncbi:MAG: enoyl-CoA hydratase/isomerase family protein [Alphaproteobacteria bacterium]